MDFEVAVIERSKEVPILVDFWAPWCGPCQYLGPILEALDQETDQWELVKLNTDEHPGISNQYGIRGIPAVKLFHHGEVVAEFTGALPKPQIEKWLAEHLPDERKEQLKLIAESVKPGEKLPEDELRRLEEMVDQNPDLFEATLLLASYLVWQEPERAMELTKSTNMANKMVLERQDVQDLAQFMTAPLNGNEKLDEQILEARRAAREQDLDRALELLIGIVMTDKTYSKELPRKAVIAIFHLLGEQHPVTKKYRRRFDMALY